MNEEQEELRSTLRAFFAETSPLSAVREVITAEPGYDTRLWKRMSAELGLSGLAVPEEFGGSGFGPVELAIACEELGRALIPGPFLASAVLSANVLLELADPEINHDILPGLAAGDIVATFAVPKRSEPVGGGAPTAVQGEEGSWRLHGTLLSVLDGGSADRVIVVANHDGEASAFLVDPAGPGVDTAPMGALDLTRRSSRIVLDGAVGRRIQCGDVSGALQRALDRAGVALAAEQLGVLRRCIDLTLDWVKVRVQFGRVVGSFQAVKHGCAQMWVRYELAESAVRHAAATAADDPADLPAAVALALSYCGDAAIATAGDMIQYFGGIGYTWEHDAHLYYRRAYSAAVLLGSPEQHRARLAELVGI